MQESTQVPEAEPELPPEGQKPEEPTPATKRGRPAGAKDKLPRVKKVRVKVEPLVVEPAPVPASGSSKTAPAPEPVPEPPEPEEEDLPSPRTLLRETSMHLVHLKGIVRDQRVANTAQAYTSRLTAWPIV